MKRIPGETKRESIASAPLSAFKMMQALACVSETRSNNVGLKAESLPEELEKRIELAGLDSSYPPESHYVPGTENGSVFS